MTERKPPGVPYERWIDRQVRSAQERGAFDSLRGAGAPLPGLDRPMTAWDWVAEWARREDLVTAAVLPPSLALRKEREDLLDGLASRGSEEQVRAEVADFNSRLRRALLRPQEGPPLTLTLLDPDEMVRRWHGSRPPAQDPVPPAAPARPLPRSRWWFLPWGRRARTPSPTPDEGMRGPSSG